MEKKICSKCRIEKLLTDFYKRNDTKSGYRADCKQCILSKKSRMPRQKKCKDCKILKLLYENFNKRKCGSYRDKCNECINKIIIINISKVCLGCQINKDLSEYHDNFGKSLDGKRSRCKECINKFNKLCVENLSINKKKELKKQSQEYRKSPQGVYLRYRRSAKNRNIKFELTLVQFTKKIINEKCFFCNEFFEILGIDRLDNSDYYKIGNIVPCCAVCNRMKNKHSLKEYYQKITQIYKTLKKKIEII